MSDRLQQIREAVARDGANLEDAYADRRWLLRELDARMEPLRLTAAWIAIKDREPYGMDFPILMSAPGWKGAEAVIHHDDYVWQRDSEGATHWLPQPNPPPSTGKE